MPVLLAHVVEDSTNIFGISGGGVEPPKPPLLGTPLLLVNEETALKDMIDKIIENGRCYGMEIYVEKTKIMKISRQPFPLKIMIDQKKTTECGMF